MFEPTKKSIILSRPRVSVLIDNPRSFGSPNPRQIEIEGLLDTGATLVVIPLTMAAHLGLARVGRCDIQTPSGQHRGFLYDGIITLPALNQTCEVQIASIVNASFDGPDTLPLVLLGKAFLQHFNFCMYGPEATFSLAVP
jgi:predicted aspartyl protease